MITKIQISPKIGVFHVEVSLNSWELPGGKIFLSSKHLISEFYVDERESLVLPKTQDDLYVYNLPNAHKYRFSYQIFIEPNTDWLMIEDNGAYLPFLGEDNPPMRRTEIILPRDLVALSNHKMDKVQQRQGLLRFIFEGQNAGLFSIAPYYGDKIFSGNFYYLDKATNTELLNRFLRQAWDYMYKNYGEVSYQGFLNYAVLPQGYEAFSLDKVIFFPWPEESGLRAYEELIKLYLALGWRVEGQEDLLVGLRQFFLSEIASGIYSEKELAELKSEYSDHLERIKDKPLSGLVARDLSLGIWKFLEEIKGFLGSQAFYPILKLIMARSHNNELDLDLLLKSFSDLAWKEGIEDFLDKMR